MCPVHLCAFKISFYNKKKILIHLLLRESMILYSWKHLFFFELLKLNSIFLLNIMKIINLQMWACIFLFNSMKTQHVWAWFFPFIRRWDLQWCVQRLHPHGIRESREAETQGEPGSVAISTPTDLWVGVMMCSQWTILLG